MWNRRDISEVTKIKVYWAVVLTTLLYGCATWTTDQQHIKKINQFLRKILCITWQKNKPDTKDLTRASLPSIYTILMQSQLRWNSHVRMKDHHLPKKLLNCLRASAFKKARKSASKTHWRSSWNLSVLPLIAWNIWYKTERSGMKLSNVERKSETCLLLWKSVSNWRVS